VRLLSAALMPVRGALLLWLKEVLPELQALAALSVAERLARNAAGSRCRRPGARPLLDGSRSRYASGCRGPAGASSGRGSHDEPLSGKVNPMKSLTVTASCLSFLFALGGLLERKQSGRIEMNGQEKVQLASESSEKASSFLGVEVESAGGQVLGEIADLIIENGRIAGAIVVKRGAQEGEQSAIEIPWERLEKQAESGSFQVGEK
jgi:sporulation protein YlmC with PRC-barrel domain